MSRYVVVLPLAPLERGDEFEARDWPLHVTVVGNFATQAPEAHLVEDLEVIARSLSPIWVTAAHDERFGPSGDIAVTMLAEPALLEPVHLRLVAALEERGIELDVPGFSGAGYRPHVTVARHGRVREGDRMRLEQVALVDMSPNGVDDSRAVVAAISISRHV